MRRILAQQLPGVPSDARTLHDATRNETNRRAVGSWTLIALGTLGLTLALVGLYGLVAYSVTLRTREFAIRLALGASPARLLRLVAGQAVSPVGMGFAIGTAASIAVARPLAFIFSGTSVADPVGVGLTMGLFLSAAAAAAWGPARRAAQTEPAQQLR